MVVGVLDVGALDVGAEGRVWVWVLGRSMSGRSMSVLRDGMDTGALDVEALDVVAERRVWGRSMSGRSWHRCRFLDALPSVSVAGFLATEAGARSRT